jgi:tRNA(fMet)-specific endonuclease VapC
MGRVILDSCVLIAAERGGLDPADIVVPEDEVAIAAITVAELLHGVERADRERRKARREWVDEIVTTLPIEQYDGSAARVHARMLAHSGRAGRPRGAHDLIIAATAVASYRTVVTTDRGFVGLPGLDVRLVA